MVEIMTVKSDGISTDEQISRVLYELDSFFSVDVQKVFDFSRINALLLDQLKLTYIATLVLVMGLKQAPDKFMSAANKLTMESHPFIVDLSKTTLDSKNLFSDLQTVFTSESESINLPYSITSNSSSTPNKKEMNDSIVSKVYDFNVEISRDSPLNLLKSFISCPDDSLLLCETEKLKERISEQQHLIDELEMTKDLHRENLSRLNVKCDHLNGIIKRKDTILSDLQDELETCKEDLENERAANVNLKSNYIKLEKKYEELVQINVVLKDKNFKYRQRLLQNSSYIKRDNKCRPSVLHQLQESIDNVSTIKHSIHKKYLTLCASESNEVPKISVYCQTYDWDDSKDKNDDPLDVHVENAPESIANIFLSDEMNKMDEENRNLRRVNHELKLENDEYQNNLSSTLTKIKRIEEDYHNLSKSHDLIFMDKQNDAKQLASLTDENNNLKRDMVHLKFVSDSHMNDFNQKIIMLTEENKLLLSDRELHKDEHEITLSELENLKSKYVNQKTHLSKVENYVEYLEKDVAHYKLRLNESDAELNAKSGKLKESQLEIERLKDLLDQPTPESNSSKPSGSPDRQLNILNTKIKELKLTIDFENNRNEELLDIKNDLEAKLLVSKKQLSMTSEKLDLVEAVKDELREKLCEVQDSCLSSTKEFEEQKLKLCALEAENKFINDKLKEMSQLNQEKNQLFTELSIMKEYQQNLISKLVHLECLNEQLSAKLNNYRMQTPTSSVSSFLLTNKENISLPDFDRNLSASMNSLNKSSQNKEEDAIFKKPDIPKRTHKRVQNSTSMWNDGCDWTFLASPKSCKKLPRDSYVNLPVIKSTSEGDLHSLKKGRSSKGKLASSIGKSVGFLKMHRK